MPAHTSALANVYAKSLFQLAKEAGGQAKITEVGEELEQICELMRGNKTVREFFASPIIDKKSRSKSLRQIFTNRVTDLTLRFLLVLNDNGRLNQLEAVAGAFDHLVQEAFGRIEVDVYTAAPLGREQVESIRQRVREALGREPVLHPYTEPSMLGGLKLRIGDQLIDGSVASKLRRIKRGILTDGASRLRDHMTKFIQDR